MMSTLPPSAIYSWKLGLFETKKAAFRGQLVFRFLIQHVGARHMLSLTLKWGSTHQLHVQLLCIVLRFTYFRGSGVGEKTVLQLTNKNFRPARNDKSKSYFCTNINSTFSNLWKSIGNHTELTIKQPVNIFSINTIRLLELNSTLFKAFVSLKVFKLLN